MKGPDANATRGQARQIQDRSYHTGPVSFPARRSNPDGRFEGDALAVILTTASLIGPEESSLAAGQANLTPRTLPNMRL